MRLILLTEHCAANDATDAAESDERGRAESALPLTTDVVGLPCQDARHVRIAG